MRVSMNRARRPPSHPRRGPDWPSRQPPVRPGRPDL
jgi:hypothetical protein